jgi:small-conductance mechanosensitive channel
MDLHNRIGQVLSDERFLFNFLAIHIVLGLTLIASLFIRRLLIQGSNQLVRLTGVHWLDGISKEAVRRVRALIFWITLGIMVVTLAAGLVYHFAGRDIRTDLVAWYTHLTGADVLQVGLVIGQLTLLSVASWMGVRLLRRLRTFGQAHAKHWLPQVHQAPDVETQGGVALGPSAEDASPTKRHEESVTRWFLLLERYALAVVFLGTLWAAGHVVGLGEAADGVVGFLLRVLTILAAARLLTLACRTISHALAALGNRHLGRGHFRLYWERVTRLFPFGERCFEAAVYVSAASLCIRELEFIAVIAGIGPRIVQCIGIFFGTRVVIELSHVLINEAFGMYSEDRAVDQKGQTLVPLLQSMAQYVLYFGSAIMMLGVMKIDTTPILAGAGILGLAGGLGAQSLVTDVVSGFFILFENQYLVGDIVKIGDASGRVEAVSIRCTQIRDDQGRLHIVPNGQIKSLVNFSKGYVNAEVDIKVPASTNLEEVFRAMADAGRRLRQTRREVLGETVIKGLVDLSLNDMTVRAVTKVQPGTHHAMQNEYRRLLKEVFEQYQLGKRAA